VSKSTTLDDLDRSLMHCVSKHTCHVVTFNPLLGSGRLQRMFNLMLARPEL